MQIFFGQVLNRFGWLNGLWGQRNISRLLMKAYEHEHNSYLNCQKVLNKEKAIEW
jgi:uncharacterized protein YqgQ